MMNVYRVKLALRVSGSWKSSEVLTRIHGCTSTLEPSVNTTAITTRSSSGWSRSCPSLTASLPISAILTRHPLIASSPLIRKSCGIHTIHPSVSSGLIPKSSCVTVTRGKTRKQGKKDFYQKQDEDEDTEDDDEEEMELESGSDFRELKARVSSLRVDAILKAGLNMSRNKVETAFYASKIRINEQKLLKKSHQCHQGDEIDVIKAVSKENPNNMYVARVIIVALGNMNEDEEKITVKLRRYPNLLIETYEGYTPSEEEE